MLSEEQIVRLREVSAVGFSVARDTNDDKMAFHHFGTFEACSYILGLPSGITAELLDGPRAPQAVYDFAVAHLEKLQIKHGAAW